MRSSEMLMIVPTRGRPQSMLPIVQAFADTEAKCHLTFAIDEDDPEYGRYRDEFDKLWVAYHALSLITGPRLRLAGTLNEVARIRLRPNTVDGSRDVRFIGFMGDDHRPRTKGWDARFAECLSGGTGIVYGNDLLVGKSFPTAVMMTADIPTTLGYMCPPGLVHLCLDLVWKDWGDGIGRITYLDDVVLEHLHPANGKAQLDTGYAECNSVKQVADDTAAYLDYRNNGALAADLDKLRKLLG